MTEILFQTDEFLVRRVGCGQSEACFVTFASFADLCSLNQPGFGESFFRRHGIDAIHVIVAVNRWYAHDGFESALEAIRAAVVSYKRVITYGSSMGGYAAIRFAETIGAQVALAISPQYSVTSASAPFETRWRDVTRQTQRLAWLGPHGSTTTQPIVFFDPYDLDVLHWRLIAAHYPRARAAPLPHAGHPAGAYLNETGVLGEILIAAAQGSTVPDAVFRLARKRRRESGQYLFTLARRLGPRHQALKLRLAQEACAAKEDAAYLIYLALLMEKCGDRTGAGKLHEHALLRLPNHPVSLAAAAGFHLRGGDFKRAILYARQNFRIGRSRESAALLAAVLASAGRFGAARIALETTKTSPFDQLLLKEPLLGRHLAARRLTAPCRFESAFAHMDEWAQRRKWLRRFRKLMMTPA